VTGQDAYDGPLSALRSRVDDLGAWLGIWENRTEPDAHARRCASDAVDAVDAMLRDLYGVRAQLVSEIRRAGVGLQGPAAQALPVSAVQDDAPPAIIRPAGRFVPWPHKLPVGDGTTPRLADAR